MTTDVTQARDSGYTVRDCRWEDIDQIVSIEDASFPDPYDRRTFAYLLSEATAFLVAERGAEIAGYVIASVENCIGLIFSIAVSPPHRRRGVGSILMREALGRLAGRAKEVRLQVRVGNEDAIEFYRNLGFREVGVIRRYYSDGDDAILMTLETVR